MDNNNLIEKFRLAESYLTEIEDSLEHIQPNEQSAYPIMDNIKLALNQIRQIETINSDFIYDGLSIKEIKASILAHRAFIKNYCLNKRSDAVNDLKQSLKLWNTPMGNHGLGVIYAQMGKKNEALVHFRKAVELDPKNLEYRKDLDRIEQKSDTMLKVGAFKGSWKFFLIILVIGLINLFNPKGPLIGIILVGIAVGYWIYKSRK